MFKKTTILLCACISCLALLTACEDSAGPSLQQGAESGTYGVDAGTPAGGTGTVSGDEEGAGGTQGGGGTVGDQGGESGEKITPGFVGLSPSIPGLEKVKQPEYKPPSEPEDTGDISKVIGAIKKNISKIIDYIVGKKPSQQGPAGQESGAPGGQPVGGVSGGNEYPDEGGYPEGAERPEVDEGPSGGVFDQKEAESALEDIENWIEGLLGGAAGGGVEGQADASDGEQVPGTGGETDALEQAHEEAEAARGENTPEGTSMHEEDKAPGTGDAASTGAEEKGSDGGATGQESEASSGAVVSSEEENHAGSGPSGAAPGPDDAAARGAGETGSGEKGLEDYERSQGISTGPSASSASDAADAAAYEKIKKQMGLGDYQKR